MAYVKFFNFDGYIKGYAASFNYGPTYKGIDGVLVWDGPLPNATGEIQKEKAEIKYNAETNTVYVSNTDKIAKVSLINTIGQTVKTVNNTAKISTSDIKKGFYIISVETQKGNILTNKVLIN